MTGHDDFDRTLSDWLEAEALSRHVAGRRPGSCRRCHPWPTTSAGLALAAR